MKLALLWAWIQYKCVSVFYCIKLYLGCTRRTHACLLHHGHIHIFVGQPLVAPGVVNLQVAQSVGCVAAVLTGVLLDDIVDLHVASQMGRLCGLIRTPSLQIKQKNLFPRNIFVSCTSRYWKKCIECLNDESLLELKFVNTVQKNWFLIL